VIPGVSGANGVIGPSLAGLARRSFIAGSFVNERERLEMWIVQPQQLQPGSAMPAVGVTPAQARHIAAYLYTLR
jgi:cytochrome c